MTFTELDDAFAELERRADAAGDTVGFRGGNRPGRRQPSRPVRGGAKAVAVAASVAAVAAVAIAIPLASSRDSHHVTAAGNAPAASSQSITAPAQTSTTASAASATTQATVPTTDVPATQAALISRFRSILGDTATFTVESAESTDTLITGVLTSTSGTRGLYVSSWTRTSLPAA